MSFVKKELLSQFNKGKMGSTLREQVIAILSELRFSIKTKGVFPKDGPVLLVANHPTGPLDVLALFAAIPRRDVFFIGLASYAQLGPEVKKRLIPIFRKKNLKELFYPSRFQKHVVADETEMRARNRESIRKAADGINAGKVVVIFPAGSGGKKPNEGEWKPGVGHLAAQIINPSTKIVFSHLSGYTKLDMLRFLKLGKIGELFGHKTITVRHRSHDFDDIKVLESDPKKLTRMLEDQYSLEKFE